MKTMAIYFGDLNEEARQTFIEIFGEDGNYYFFPLFIYEQEEEDEE